MPEIYEEMIRMNEYLPFHVGLLYQHHVDKAFSELNENDLNRENSIESLKKLIIAKNEFTSPMTDAYMLQYLRTRKFDVSEAYKLMRNFYETKKAHPQCYTKFDYEKLGKLARAGYFLPYRTPDGCAVMVLEFGHWNVKENDMADVMSMLAIILLAGAEDPVTQVCGVRAILNVKGICFRQVTQITPKYMVLLSKALRNCMPTRFKSIHVVNESPLFKSFWSIMKIFLSEKIKERFFFHGTNLKQMHDLIPEAILTEEYEGCNKFFDPEKSSKKMLADMEPILEGILKCGMKN